MWNAINVFRSFLSTEAPPTKVLEVYPDKYSDRHIYCREDNIILYEPQASQTKKDKPQYEIVMHRHTATLPKAYSLFRSEEKREAEIRFICFKDKIPVFIEIVKDMYNLNGLQKICDVLVEHSTWTLAHLAAYFSVYNSFNNFQIRRFLDSSDAATGMSSLQVAVKTNNLTMVQILVNSKCSLEHLDNQANSVFHYAASTNENIILALSQGPSPLRCLDSRNQNGHTPLHMACLADKPDCVKALLLAGANVNVVFNSPSYPNIFE